jgi:hypothetical protein
MGGHTALHYGKYPFFYMANGNLNDCPNCVNYQGKQSAALRSEIGAGRDGYNKSCEEH